CVVNVENTLPGVPFYEANSSSVNDILPGSKVNPVAQPTERITLPNFSRAADTHNRCIFLQCDSSTQRLVPFVLRVRLLKDHKFYIPPRCCICELHLARQSWSDLLDTENAIRKWYWLGRTKEQFRELEAQLPIFQKRTTSLAVYLMKLRTGDSDERISSLLKIGRSTLSRLVAKAREVMTESFVPAHLGLEHLNREEVAARNIYIPESLFGNPKANMEDRKAIESCQTVLVVCCDGYILYVLGPYAATKSDADILKDEFWQQH
ncbi:hypothetical protein SFRURICE_006214, partial [Spodoptera frugiperda]